MTRRLHNRRTGASNHAITAKTYATVAARDADIAWNQNPVNMFKTVNVATVGVQIMTGLGVFHTLVQTALFTPADATAAGNVGDIRADAGYLYVCVGDAEWERVAIATWP